MKKFLVLVTLVLGFSGAAQANSVFKCYGDYDHFDDTCYQNNGYSQHFYYQESNLMEYEAPNENS